MKFDFLKLKNPFERKASPVQLTDAEDAEVGDMVHFISAARNAGFETAGSKIDGPVSAVAAELAALEQAQNPENAARMAWANRHLGQ